ncbi:MAG: TraR/DksA C4-type zinc finger protein [Patescibacteria group bacterium]
MDQRALDHLQRQLTAEQKKIAAQLKAMTAEAGSPDTDQAQVKWRELGDKDEDGALEVADYQDSISLERDLQKNLGHIERALDRMAAGTYGACEVCGKPIEEQRLAANPAGATCLSCVAAQRTA